MKNNEKLGWSKEYDLWNPLRGGWGQVTEVEEWDQVSWEEWIEGEELIFNSL